MQLFRSLCMNAADEVWHTAGTGLRRAMWWQSCVMRCTVSTESAVRVCSLPRIVRGSPYISSATDACRSALNAMRIPRRTKERASVYYWSPWHMMAVLSVQWKHSTNSVAGDGGQLSRIAKFHSIWPESGRVVIQTGIPGEWYWPVGNQTVISIWLEGHIHQFWLCCLGWG
jgi:hypothetical protein